MMRVPAGLVLALSVLTLWSHAEPPAAVPAGREGQAGFTTKLDFAYLARGGERRERKVYLWYPAGVPAAAYKYSGIQEGMVALDGPLAAGRHPLVLFSHGFWGAADQSIFLMEALARNGYIVASLHHDDAIPNHRERPVDLPNFVNAKAWDDDKFFDRREDMCALLDYLLAADGEAGSVLFEHIRRDAIGAAGHSLGGYTALGLAGARPAWKDGRISAALLLSPYVQPFLFNGDLKAVKIPVMFQGGTLDVGITPFLKSIYKRIAAPKYFLVMKNVSHYGWTNFATVGRTTTEVLMKGNTKLIADYGVAFFDRHLLGRECEGALSDGAGVFSRWLAAP
jgi:predicted dienelactone hydrolase